METLFVEAPYEKDIELSKETCDYLKEKKYTKIALYASVQFCNNLQTIEKQLEDLGITIISSQPKRAQCQKQLLGCDCYKDSLNTEEDVDCYLYIGDGKFHPLALVYAQKDNKKTIEVVCNDPIAKTMTILTTNDIIKNLKKYKGSLIKFISATKIGVIITIKPGQEQYKHSLELEKTYPDKKLYYFIDNNISFDQLENFPFIDIWVNTACPRIGFDDHNMFQKSVLNLNDSLHANTILSKDSILNRG
ncbi:hypothetical protein HOL21_00250 [Candidatus Woesearchaeota archaeon]|jgi:2-(3-amino-3-carboxypropyl)histidine synthase|nr:hypothetical protein [Candidatus Woesearchaeota archaeon]MBT5396628.1 hypothetical protein [Candidatus Woesearchaeota archaeon]MBT5924895.1 hypothetical protein [Candidatus Woesearchaeota archaeon]MBT6367585.1 hypothetical protein [Candidatus Woesearchaeota archaeon]MBT7763084.1 hypothetical protein [Candidatus Woesearchaeota archaeon]